MADVLPDGTLVAHYRIERVLGWGGAAAVYEATDTYLDRRVALKVMSSQISSDPVFKKRFRREGGIHSSLEHPHVVPIYEADESDEHGFWIAMRLMKGGSLDGRFKRSAPLDPEWSVELLGPIAEALDFAHEQGQIHRDVKPENILLDESDVPCLTDFGIAKSIDGSRLTLTGQGIGTPGYMAPEQIEGKRMDQRVDVYSLAVVLFKCLTGTVPLPWADGIYRGRLRFTRGIPAASECNPKLPATIDPVIRKGMEKRPRKRHAKASMLIDEAREALAESAAAPSAALSDRSRWGLRGALLIGVATLALGFLGLGLGAATKTSPQSSLRRVATRGIELSMLPGWTDSKGRPAISGLGISEPISLEPPSDLEDGLSAVSAGISAARGASLLPPAYRAQLNGRTRRVPVALGALQAYRYRLRMPRTKTPVAIFVAPTTSGVATLTCKMAVLAERSAARLCSRIASTLTLKKSDALPLGPSPAFGKALRLRLTKLGKRRSADRAELSRAGDASGQASAAEDMADAFRAAAKGLASVHLSPESTKARARLVEALRSTRDAYKDLAVAARQEDQVRYGDAATEVDIGEEAVRVRLGDLQALGYRTA